MAFLSPSSNGKYIESHSLALITDKGAHCLVHDDGEQTRLVCHKDVTWLNTTMSFCLPAGHYLDHCAESFSHSGNCTVTHLNIVENGQEAYHACYSGLGQTQPVQQWNSQCQTWRSPALETLWEEIVLAPGREVLYFCRHSVDDIIEDIFGISAASFAALFLYQHRCRWLVIIPFTVAAHSAGNAIGDHFSNKLEDEQEHIHSRNWLSTMISNMVEDYVKAVYFVWEFSGFISGRLLLSYGHTLASRQTPPINIPGKIQLLSDVFSMLNFIKDSYQFINNYNWINKRADELGDEARCLANAFFDQLFPE